MPEQLDVDQRRLRLMFIEYPDGQQHQSRTGETECHGEVTLPEPGFAGDEQKRQQPGAEEHCTGDINRGPASRR